MLLRSVLTLAACVLSMPVYAAGWGSVEGQFVLDGDVPAVAPLVKAGDKTIKDAVCATSDIPDEGLQFDPESKGIANVFIYLRRAPEIHPDLKESKVKEVVFDQENCRFLPHGLIVRTDQVIVCKSSDKVSHNVRTNPFANTPQNIMIAPGTSDGVKIAMPALESLPVKVACDIHPWMLAWWKVVDHPYAVVTDEKGNFKIENLPAGNHEFTVWHEKAGYIDRKFKVAVKDGETTTLKPTKVPFSSFK